MASSRVVLPLRYGPTNAMHRGPLTALPPVSPIAGSSSVATLPREDRPFLSGNRQGGSPHALHARSNRQPWQGDCSPQRSALSSSEATPAATLSRVCPGIDGGCSAIEPLKPPISALAPSPRPADSSA